MKRIWFFFVTCLILIFAFFIFYTSMMSDDMLKRKNLVRLLFNSSNYTINQVCYKDFIGPSIHGELFEFYKYRINGESNIAASSNYPKFDSLFIGEKNATFYHWTPTPIRRNDDLKYISVLTEFGNLDEYECSKEFAKAEYLKKPGNYYSYALANFIPGNCLLIYVPSESMLYLIIMN